MGFFKSFFSGKSDSPANEKQKNEQKNFEIFKYDGMRAQRMGRTDYAIKCFTEALAIQEDFETMGYLAQVYTQTSELDEAHKLLERMTEIEPEHISTYLSLANVCYMQEDYPAMAGAAKKAIEIEEGNAMAHYLLGKADNGQGDGIMCIAHLTKAIVLKDDFIEARLLRAEALVQMQQYKEDRFAGNIPDGCPSRSPCHHDLLLPSPSHRTSLKWDAGISPRVPPSPSPAGNRVNSNHPLWAERPMHSAGQRQAHTLLPDICWRIPWYP